MIKKILAVCCLAWISVFFFADEPLRSNLAVFESSMTVYGERIPIEEKEIVTTPAPIVVITQEEIKEKGVKTFSELIETVAGALGRDITGNPVERSVDLRGFPDGTSVAVFLDGVKLNNISDNSINFEIIPIEIIDRVEIYSGALAPLYGGGAIGGVINIITKKGEAIPRIDLVYGAGSFGKREQKANFSFSKNKFNIFSSLSLRYAEGYRENDGYRLDDGLIKTEYSFDEKNSLSFLFKYEGGAVSAPGALTEDEMRQNREQSPYNKFDGSRGRHKIYALTYSQKIGENSNFVVETFERIHLNDILTTGRYLSGFQTNSDEKLGGAVMQFSQTLHGKKGVFEWSSALEYQKGRDVSKGFYTDFYGNKNSSATSTKTNEENFGGYLKASYTLPKWRFDAGYRKDEAKYDYADFFNPQNNEEKSFNEGTVRSSISYFVSEDNILFVAFSEGYKIPTVIELFSYPGFYSNPNLEPSRVNDYEIGYKYFGENFRTKFTLFKMFLRDEAVFVLTDPVWFIGMNQNIGKSYRQGIEGDFSLNLPKDYELDFSGTFRKAKVTDGLNVGKEIPMVAKEIANLSIIKRFEKSFVNFGTRYVSNQYLDNDLANIREKLPSFVVAFLNLSYTEGPLNIEVKFDNLFNKKYSTRGVTNGFNDYFNPAYPFSAGVFVKYSF
jgi:outer membrane receptor protein involved in Fe transport